MIDDKPSSNGLSTPGSLPFRVISGDYASLEDALVRWIVERKKKDVTVPMAVVTASTGLMERLMWALGQGSNCLLNIHYHTFSSFSDSIVQADGGLPKPVLSDPLFYDTLVRKLLEEDRSFPEIADLAVPDGFPPAIRSTLRDLMDAGVPPEISMEAVREGFLGRPADIGSLLELLRLYRRYLQKLDSFPIAPRSTVLKLAAERAADGSRFLSRFQMIFFYGFYDLTGLQSELFLSIANRYPASFYFPFRSDHPAFRFASRFRETVVHQARFEETVLTPSLPSAERSVKISNVSGVMDEAWYVAKEIMTLREAGVPYHEMAVVARSRERISAALAPVFREWNIPFRSSVAQTLGRHPCARLARRWLDAVQKQDATEISKDAQPVLLEWPAEDSWSGHAERAISILDNYAELGTDDTDARGLLRSGAEAMKSFDLLETKVSRDEFLRALETRWQTIELIDPDAGSPGVSLLHAEAARGLSFDALFIIGMDAKEFPRAVREDPFLRDDARLSLFNTLGHKIDSKMSGLEEEELLFHLLTASARRHLHLFYQRSDDKNKAVGASSFLRAFALEQGAELDHIERSLPKSFEKKWSGGTPSTLSERDVVVRLLSAGRESDAASIAGAATADADLLLRGTDTIRRHQLFGEAGPYDGLVAAETMSRPLVRSLSPTKLEQYARCPFQFFAYSVLDIVPENVPTSPIELEKRFLGKQIHSFLESYYRVIIESKINPAAADFPEALLEETFQRSFGQPGEGLKTLPLLWESVCAALRSELGLYLKEEWAELRREGWRPVFVEQSLSGELPPSVETDWRLRMDRIDEKDDQHVRIIDYKSGKIPSNVENDMAKGKLAQPVVSLAMLERWWDVHRGKKPAIDFVYQRVVSEHERQVAEYPFWLEHRDTLLDALARQTARIHRGIFTINPGDYCRTCEAIRVCRKNNPGHAFRAEHQSPEESAAPKPSRSKKSRPR